MPPYGQDNRNVPTQKHGEGDRLSEDSETVHEAIVDDDKETAIAHIEGDAIQKGQRRERQASPSTHPEPVLSPKAQDSQSADIAPDPKVGETVKGYELVELLGKGGAGTVFRAIRIRDGEIVALKVLAAKKITRSRVVQRFIDEAKTAESVHHECLVRMLEFIEERKPRRLAYAMEYVRGISLRAHLKRYKALHLTEAIHIARQMSHGVGALHDAGIVHRDLKPENVMIIAKDDDDRTPKVKVLDFGVAKFLTGDGLESDGPGTFVGTPRYMAPEQAAGGKVDPRSDLFAIGVMLFEMITGSRPHDGDTLKSVVMAKLRGAPRIEVNPGKEILPQELSDIVDSCLKLKPHERPDSTEEFVRVLASAYSVLSAVGPIRLVDDGALSRGEIKAVKESSFSRESRSQPVKTQSRSTYMVTGGSSDDFRRKNKAQKSRGKEKRRIQPTPLTVEKELRKKQLTAKPEVAKRKSRMRRPSILVIVFSLSVLLGIGLYFLVESGLFHESQVVQVEQVTKKVEPPEYPQPHDVLLVTEPNGVRVVVDDSVVGMTPHRVRVPIGKKSLKVTLLTPKYEPKVLTVTREAPDEMLIKLSKTAEDSSPVKKIDAENTAEPDGIEVE